MTVGLVVASRNAHLDDIAARIDAGAGPGLLEVYDGVRPPTGGTPTTLLGTLTFSDPSAPAAANGTLTFNAITEDSSADATGTATWVRATDSTGAFVADMDAGESGSGAEAIFNTTSIVAGGPIRVDSATLTAGNA